MRSAMLGWAGSCHPCLRYRVIVCTTLTADEIESGVLMLDEDRYRCLKASRSFDPVPCVETD